ncbi:lipid-A-disaccharide synthase [Siculibacillus lacustris]|uniref:Lipid-A-disaccharide synthase n=1 Tax=Siculibacillus lacustris TaxID=1549641 RepID=A0A4Q9VRG7_9HYPH|nr:lipid-A-disaccharide synthase [Siculibacillus lacustris]TBW38491.1 lipid-A-disaccharide synthase [Siculibacillus lacustris]
MSAPLSIYVVAGEASGDVLGAHLAEALARRLGDGVVFAGVGGPAMAAAGIASLFPMADIAVMGIGPVLARLPTILRRIRETAEAAIAARPDVLVLIDSPDFCHRVAARVRRARPDQKIVLWVSPTVWAWRPGRAKKIAKLADRLLALLPFEPAVHAVLGGPPTTYVGHPFLDDLAAVRPEGARALPRPGERPLRIVVLPGSRRSEISRLMAPFGAALGRVQAALGPLEVTLPAVDHLAAEIAARAAEWPVTPNLVAGRDAKYAAFRDADAALAASGTVTLELALAGLPAVAAYRLDALGRLVKHMIRVPVPVQPILTVRSVLLPNLIVGEKAMPEFIDDDCRPDTLAAALGALLVDGPERNRQIEAFARLEARMRAGVPGSPADAAADAVLEVAGR